MEQNKQKQQCACAQYSCYDPELCPLWGTDATPCVKRSKCRAYKRSMDNYVYNELIPRSYRRELATTDKYWEEYNELKQRVSSLEVDLVGKGGAR